MDRNEIANEVRTILVEIGDADLTSRAFGTAKADLGALVIKHGSEILAALREQPSVTYGPKFQHLAPLVEALDEQPSMDIAAECDRQIAATAVVGDFSKGYVQAWKDAKRLLTRQPGEASPANRGGPFYNLDDALALLALEDKTASPDSDVVMLAREALWKIARNEDAAYSRELAAHALAALEDKTDGRFPQPSRKAEAEACGECRLQPGETCDICGAKGATDGR
jgi:hypothetical protein